MITYKNYTDMTNQLTLYLFTLSVTEKSIIFVFCWVTDQMLFAHTWFLRLLLISVTKVHFYK